MTVTSLEQSHREALVRMLDNYDANDLESGKWYERGRDSIDL